MLQKKVKVENVLKSKAFLDEPVSCPVCSYLTKKKKKKKIHYTREISKAPTKVVAVIKRAAASETFINICYTSSPNRPGPV